MKPKITPTNVEVHFSPEEIIVSKTDLKGRITYANRVFMRVADYSEDDLLGVQHGSLVTLQLRLPQTQASAFVQRINDLGQGRVGWPDQLTGGS